MSEINLLRALACEAKHKAHLHFSCSDSRACHYCGESTLDLGHSGHPTVVVWQRPTGNVTWITVPDPPTSGHDMEEVGNGEPYLSFDKG